MALKTIYKIKNYLIVLIALGLIFYFFDYGKNLFSERAGETKIENKGDVGMRREDNPEPVDNTMQENTKTETENSNNHKNIPGKIFIEVPFTSQAPFANWDELHEEACEEASLVMLKYYLDKKELNKNIAEREIQDMVKFEIKKYGDYKDTTAAETAKLAGDYYRIKNLKVVYDFEKEDIKKYLAKGDPIIVPAAGRLLGNPNFTPPGPLYHNLVLVGYDGDTIISNDPGTRKGEGYKYDINILYKAIHDFSGKKENIIQGRKAMIVLE